MQTEVTELIEKLNKETSEANIEKKDEQNEQNEAAWRKAVALEIMEQDRLQVCISIINTFFKFSFFWKSIFSPETHEESFVQFDDTKNGRKTVRGKKIRAEENGLEAALVRSGVRRKVYH